MRMQFVVIHQGQVVISFCISVPVSRHFHVKVCQQIATVSLVHAPGGSCDIAFGKDIIKVHFSEEEQIISTVIFYISEIYFAGQRLVLYHPDQSAFLRMIGTNEVRNIVFVQRLDLLVKILICLRNGHILPGDLAFVIALKLNCTCLQLLLVCTY